jgi:proteasome lid subunit RPN8/RPN11/LysM repeat protein
MNGDPRVVGVRRFLVGQAGPFPRVVFREEVFAQMDQFAQEHPSGESGGFLVGRKRNLKSLEEYEIVVDQFVPLAQARGGASRFALTKDHYQAVQRSLQSSGSNLRIVGWMHSHPGFGVFLSAFDKQQHERLFNRPWQIAYVIDAQLGERALYHCVDHAWRELPGYYILRSEYGPSGDRGRGARWPRRVASLLLFILLVCAGVLGYQWVSSRYIEPSPSQVAQNTEPVPVPSRQESVVTVTPAPPSVTQSQSAEQRPEPPKPREYVVARGDSLWTIAEKVYGDARLYRLIAEANNISNPSRLRTGQVLVIPDNPEE